MFDERIDKIKKLVEKNKIEEAFREYKVLVLLVKKLDIDKFEISKKIKFLGDELVLKILRKKINEPIKVKEKIDIKEFIETGKFYDKLKSHQEICNLIDKEDYEGALKKFKKC